MRLLVLSLLLLSVTACSGAPGAEASGGDGLERGSWSYAKGPHGEDCLFYLYGVGYLTMSCNEVKP